ncbi:unnamed protein product [Sphenostylis stenocarpa]|uniref:non-specific serine/threonine protein kinase n=1 Tax=Sphenostylis stenocarpa TaxID=92480 RepID=A0AA86VEG7_9FABA|nr:unnamed protein product [Sphenostylis stenocarpa]
MLERNSSVHRQFVTPRRSPRFLPQQNNTTPNPKSAKHTVSKKESNEFTVGPRRSSRLNNGDVGFSSLRRSPRFNNESSGKKVKNTSVKGGDAETKENCVVSDEGFGGGRKKERKEKRAEVKKQKNHVVSDEGIGGGAKKGGDGKKVEVEITRNGVVSNGGAGGGRRKGGNGEIVEVKTKENRVVCDKDFDGERKKIEDGDKRKRKGDEVREGWTKEQDLALQRAYLMAKPSPHFWKNVSKLVCILLSRYAVVNIDFWFDFNMEQTDSYQVPGKSQQECFDRIHFDHVTPLQPQPRSRAKTLKSSPIHDFSLSESKLLNPIDTTVRRLNVLKPKNIITQKSVEKLLQWHLEGDLDREGDIFSVLEPNIDFSTNASQPSEALSTPKQLKENKGCLQSCTETSSSSGKKPLSRFSGSHITDLVSPPVLKKVKNRVLHEKYVNQLRCRESRRRAASMKIIGEGGSTKKKDAVKAAKVALVSEARDAINKFRESQVNFMDNAFTSDGDNDDNIEFEDERTGAYGSVYKAQLPSGRIVALKKLHKAESENPSFYKSFCNETQILTEIRHRNIIKLYGFCLHNKCMFLVYEYMERGSLFCNLSYDVEAQELNWRKRINIVKGIAYGLEFRMIDQNTFMTDQSKI